MAVSTGNVSSKNFVARVANASREIGHVTGLQIVVMKVMKMDRYATIH
jgi:hypothetical protein